MGVVLINYPRGGQLAMVKWLCNKHHLVYRGGLVFRSSMSKAKKGAAEEPAPLLGRVGTSLKVGIVGLPNVG